jgi:hypothetical protein
MAQNGEDGFLLSYDTILHLRVLWGIFWPADDGVLTETSMEFKKLGCLLL